MAKESKQVELEALKKQIISDNVCPELANNATNLVFGSGNEDADIVFVGEAPGKNEDIAGLPFVGMAGQVLEEMLAKINLKREQIYITNIVKYRPPSNRDPLPEEKLAFLPYLKKQLSIIKPRLVITLGRHSMNCFFPNLYISNVHGKIQDLNGQKFYPIFHPAAALYNGSLRPVLEEDFLKIPNILETI
ncbi:MAG TPA: uracil-DNA glycosylase [Candidatus Saccharimonadia bacterium]|nr:uracil-DNA glycosylase [Candidatus Saccharimonadia bacterium]